MAKKRNYTIDMLRGIAMLSVIFRHATTENLINAEAFFLNRFFWNSTMAMFFLLSGYVTAYSKPASRVSELSKIMIKQTRAYLMPFFVWTVFVQGMFVSRWNIEMILPKVLQLLSNVNTGYWYLLSLWTVSMIFMLGRFISNTLLKRDCAIFNCIFSVIPYCGFGILMMLCGSGFFSLKYTLFYTPFYCVGYLINAFDLETICKKHEKLVDFITCICAIYFVAFVSKIDTQLLPDTIPFIALRFASSMTGCVMILGIIRKIQYNATSKIHKVLVYLGQNSLTMYLSHYLFISAFKFCAVELATVVGLVETLIVIVVTTIATCTLSEILNRNQILSFVFLGKVPRYVE